MAFAMCMHNPGVPLYVSDSSCQDTSQIGQEPTLMPHSNLIPSLMALSPSTVTFCGVGG